MSEQNNDCDKCHLPMKKYSVAGHQWLKCLNPYCGKIVYLDRKPK